MEEKKCCGNCLYSHDKDGEFQGKCRLLNKKKCSSGDGFCAGWQWVNARKMGSDQNPLFQLPLTSHSKDCCWAIAVNNHIIHTWDDKKGYYIMSKSKNFTFDLTYCPFCGVKLSDVKE